MICVESIGAGEGDCLWIEYGEEECYRILIDGGTRATYKQLKKRIERLPLDARHFELLVITHIDADHIGGVLRLLEDEGLGVTFADIWFNGLRHLGGGRTKGVMQGERLSDYLTHTASAWNGAFDGEAVVVKEEAVGVPIALRGGVELILLSPTQEALTSLQPHWLKEMKRATLKSRDSSETPHPIGRRGETLGDIDTLAKTPFESDTSLTNASSIAFLLRYEGKQMLFSGDAYATTLLETIEQYLPACESLSLDLFKVPHHGSDGNLSQALLQRLRCHRYLISTNGARHHHPDVVAIARILKYGGDSPTLYFNYHSHYTAVWGERGLPAQYHYHVVYPTKNHTGVTLHF